MPDQSDITRIQTLRKQAQGLANLTSRDEFVKKYTLLHNQIIEAVGPKTPEAQWFTTYGSVMDVMETLSPNRTHTAAHFENDKKRLAQDINNLERVEALFKSRFDSQKLSAVAKRQAKKPSVFIAHGGKPTALTKLEEFLQAIGCEPIVAEKQPSEGRSANEHVEWCLDQADCAIVLGTAENLEQGKPFSRPNVFIELGRFQERFPDKIIYLLEEGAQFPSNVSEKIWGRFTQENMEEAFLKVVRELTAFGYLNAEVAQ